MKFPKIDVVKFVVKSTLRRRVANSQAELREMVNKELKKVDPEYTISGRRLRMIVTSMPEVGMKIDVKKGKMSKKCPSCGSGLKKAWTKNLRGRKILENLKCHKCGYKGHDGKWQPGKYGFRLDKKS